MFLHIVERCVYVSCDGGRICRPLIILDPVTHQPKLTEQHIQELTNNLRDFASLIREGVIEYVSTSQQVPVHVLPRGVPSVYVRVTCQALSAHVNHMQPLVRLLIVLSQIRRRERGKQLHGRSEGAAHHPELYTHGNRPSHNHGRRFRACSFPSSQPGRCERARDRQQNE